jgi:Chaperone of endosialidase
MAVPYTFGSATTSIPLSQLDSNFATAITLGNTAVQLGNTITSLTGVSNVASATSLSLGSNGNTTAVTITTAQNVGIGTTSPDRKLYVQTPTAGASLGSNAVVFSDATNATMELKQSTTENQWYSNVLMSFGVNGSTRAVIDTSGNVGIGTSSPSTKLHVSNGSVRSSNSGNTIYTELASDGVYTTGSALYLLGPAGKEVKFYSNNAYAGQFDSSGNLLIGVGSSSYGGGIFLQKSYQGNTIANFENTYSGSGGQSLRAKVSAASNNTSSYIFVGASNNDVFYIYGNGNAVNSNNSYGGISDIKLKDNIVDATPKLADVMQLKVRNFNFKTDPDHKQIGFIAQELEEVFPALIDNTTSPDDPNDVTKAIKTSVLIPILVKAIQELKAIVDTQAAEIEALKAKVGA